MVRISYQAGLEGGGSDWGFLPYIEGGEIDFGKRDNASIEVEVFLLEFRRGMWCVGEGVYGTVQYAWGAAGMRKF